MIANSPYYIKRGRATLALPLIIGIAFAAIVSGVFAAILPWWVFAILLVLPTLGLAAIVWPYLGLLGLILLVSGIVPSQLLPEVNLGPGKLLGTDIAIGMLMGFVLFKALVNNNEALIASRSYLMPVMLFLACIPICSAVGYMMFHTPAKEVLNEARAQVYWLLCLMPIYFISRPADLNRVAWGLVAIGVVLATMVVIQFAFGVHLLENARTEDLRTMGTTYTNVTRSTAGGAIYLIVFPLFFLIARLLTKTLHPLVVLPLVAILTAGIVVSFGRGIWLAGAAGLCGIAWSIGGFRSLQKLVLVMLFGVVMGVATLAAFNPDVINAAGERLVSTFSEGKDKTSLDNRFEENAFAIGKIASSPVIGIGFGTPYKPRLDFGVDWSQVRYIHNAYLGIWMKLGLLGIVAAAWLSFVIYRRAMKLLRRGDLDPKLRAMATACLAAFFVPVVTSLTQPEWLITSGVAFFALMTGLIAALDYHSRPKAVSTQ